MDFTTQKLTEVLQAAYYGNHNQLEIAEISIDSRSLRNNNNTLFFAIKGKHHDAHRYISELYEKGVRFFVVEKGWKLPDNGADFFVVEDSVKSLQLFAQYYRLLFDIPVIGITGSNGKTIVKEWLNYLLSPFYSIIKNPKSYNSQVGVPLSVVAINKEHNLGIFEAGISLPDEMQPLEEIIQPNIGILTSIGSAHDEGFIDRNQKIKEKIKLFQHCKIIVTPHIKEVVYQLPKEAEIWNWTFKKEMKARLRFEVDKQKKKMAVYDDKYSFEVSIPFIDKASLQNIATCITTMLALNIDQQSIQKDIPKLFKVEMRLQVLTGIRNTTIIDDSYSSDYQSLKIALDFLNQQKTHNQKVAILSDIQQSGFSDEVLYKKVAQLLEENHIETIVGIGPSITKYLAHIPVFYAYSDTLQFLNSGFLSGCSDQTLLIKGARTFGFEKIVSELVEKTHETVLEINLDAITHNYNYYRSHLKSDTKMMVMVKAFGYGNGSYEIAKLLMHLKADYLGVAFADEGVELRKAGISLPIIVMNPEQSAFPTMIAYQLEPEIYSLQELKAFLRVAHIHNVYQYPIHIKLNTGMNRLGFAENDIDLLAKILNRTNMIRVQSVFSHLATSDMPEEKAFTLQQIQKFSDWSERLFSQLTYRPIRHILNTSGIHSFSEYQMEMVRLGIGLYGVGNSVEEQQNLKNVATLKTVILQTHTIDDSESVGYGRRFIAKGTREIATIAIGYADGIRRAYGNEVGRVWVNGKLAPIIGSICMDMMMIDITDCDAKTGDEVVVFGEAFHITEVAKLWNTIPYEVMTSISHRVKRIFYKE